MKMIDVGAKEKTERVAVARGFVSMSPATVGIVRRGESEKGDVIAAARLAGIMAAKRTPDLVPLCHPLLLTHADVQAAVSTTGVRFEASVTCAGSTGVEMEALVAASVAALTLYDMVKAVERGATIERVRLLEKTGGKSGTYKAIRNLRK